MGTYNLFIDILLRLHVKHVSETSIQQFEEHPDNDNMYGLYEMLRSYHIETLGVQLPATEESLRQLDCPFVAYADHELVLVTHINPDSVTYVWKGKDITLSYQDFVKQWSGAVLGFEASSESIEPDYDAKRREQLTKKLTKYVSLASILVAWLCLYIIQPSPWSSTALPAFFSMAGLFVSYLLVQKQVTGASEYADKICSLLLHAKDCNKVLNSTYSKFFGISLSSIGLGYFLCNLLLILDSGNLACMLLVNIVALLFTLWSLWTQKFKVKQWCALCMLVLFCLWATCFSLWFTSNTDIMSINLIRFIGICCLYLTFMLLVHFFVSGKVKAKELEKTKRQYNRIKADEIVFEALLEQQKSYPVDRRIGLILGNAQAGNCITIVSNPHCAPCARLHSYVEKLYQQSSGKLCLQFILTSFSKDLEPSAMLLIQQYQRLNDDKKFLDFLAEWFEKGKLDKESFYQRYELDQHDEVMLQQFEIQKQWIHQTHITTTPTILVNGRLLPEQYELSDMSYFIHS